MTGAGADPSALEDFTLAVFRELYGFPSAGDIRMEDH